MMPISCCASGKWFGEGWWVHHDVEVRIRWRNSQLAEAWPNSEPGLRLHDSVVRLLWWTCFDQTFRMCNKWFYMGGFSIPKTLNPSDEAGATQETRRLLSLVGDREFTKLSSGHMVAGLYVNLQHWETSEWVTRSEDWNHVGVYIHWVHCCLSISFLPFLNPNHLRKTFLVVHSVSRSGNTIFYRKW